MVKIIVNEASSCIEVRGDIMTVVAELGYAIGTIYGKLQRFGDPAAAELFRAAIHTATLPDSLVWDVDAPGATFIQVKEKDGAPTDQS